MLIRNIYIIIICSFVFLLVGYTLLVPRSFRKCTNKQYTTISEDEIAIIYDILYHTHIILEKHNIPYFAIGGTLLGAVRHGGIIPWDDDADIAIMDYDEARLVQLHEEFEKVGLQIEKFSDESISQHIYKIKKKGLQYPFMDIFIFTNNNGLLHSKFPEWHFPKEELFVQEVYPLRLYQFGHIHIYGPYNPIPYFKRFFGNEWESHFVIHHSHREDEEEYGTASEKMKLSKEFRCFI